MVDVFRNGELEADVIEEIRENYDLIANGEPTNYQEEKDFDMAIWDGEMEEYLELLGIKYDLSGIDIPEDRKERLFNEYFAQTIDFDDKGNVIKNLPTIDKKKIVINNGAIKTEGKFVAVIKLHPEVEVKININVQGTK